MPDVESELGISAVLCNTEKGQRAFKRIFPYVNKGNSTIEDVLRGNPVLEKSMKPYDRYDEFMNDIKEDVPISVMQKKWTFRPSIMQRVRWRMKGLRS